ncbi:MAG: tautomerase family protein [Proteobacteria bacterium]|nr:tautomerase family protein [Pseudomonadota bacterium]
MPEIVVYMLAGRPPDQRRRLMSDITDAVARNLQIDPGAVVVTLVETAGDLKMKGGVLFSERAPRR